MESVYAPIAIFVFKRPAHTAEMLDHLNKCPEFGRSPLYIFCDGPRNDADLENVEATRKVVRDALGDRATIIEQSKNHGLAQSILSGVTDLCESHGRVIVIEDDLQVSPSFLTFMNATLEQYQSNPAVHQISGHMFPVDCGTKEDAVFLPFTTSWGWATWKNQWLAFIKNRDRDLGWAKEKLLNDRAEQRKFDLDGAYPYTKILKNTLSDRADSWAILWYLFVYRKKGVVLYPTKSLVSNIGFDGSGTHTHTPQADASLFDGRLHEFPKQPAINAKAFRKVKSFLWWQGLFLTKVFRRLAFRLPKALTQNA